MLWLFLGGGLRPIPSQAWLDGGALVGLALAVAAQSASRGAWSLQVVLLSIPYALVLATSGLSNRWTLTLPMAPLLAVQLLRIFLVLPKKVSSSTTTTSVKVWKWCDRLLVLLSWLLIVLAVRS